MSYVYCRQWFRAKKQILDDYSPEKALELHSERSLYTAVKLKSGKPVAFAEVSNDFIGIGILDDHCREYVSYQFQEVEPRRVFLTMATYRKFSDGSDTPTCGTTYFFELDGKVAIEKSDLVGNNKTTSESICDASGNWEPYPGFGDYGHLMKKER